MKVNRPIINTVQKCILYFHEYFPQKLFFLESLKYKKNQIVFTIIFPLCNENLNTFLTRLRKLSKGGMH